MKHFTLERYSLLSQEMIYHISTDVENFHLVMPDYFKSLIVLKEKNNEKIVLEKIKFLGMTLKIKTKHVIKKPNIHEVHIMSGPTKGTVFVESYIQLDNETAIAIDVHLKLSGFMKLFGFLENLIAKKMNSTLDEFIVSAEKYSKSTLATS